MTGDELWMGEALKEARAALEAGEMPVGAVIVRDGRLIARGRNAREAGMDPTAHAEIVAIRRAARALGGWRLNGCCLYVTLEPCPMCAGAVVAARISRVVYGARDAQRGCAGSVYRITEDAAFNHCARADGGVRGGECAQLLDDFFASRRRPSSIREK